MVVVDGVDVNVEEVLGEVAVEVVVGEVVVEVVVGEVVVEVVVVVDLVEVVEVVVEIVVDVDVVVGTMSTYVSENPDHSTEPSDMNLINNVLPIAV